MWRGTGDLENRASLGAKLVDTSGARQSLRCELARVLVLPLAPKAKKPAFRLVLIRMFTYHPRNFLARSSTLSLS